MKFSGNDDITVSEAIEHLKNLVEHNFPDISIKTNTELITYITTVFETIHPGKDITNQIKQSTNVPEHIKIYEIEHDEYHLESSRYSVIFPQITRIIQVPPNIARFTLNAKTMYIESIRSTIHEIEDLMCKFAFDFIINSGAKIPGVTIPKCEFETPIAVSPYASKDTIIVHPAIYHKLLIWLMNANPPLYRYHDGID